MSEPAMAQPESLRLLHYVNQLREESDQAMKALQSEESNNKALEEALALEEREQQTLVSQINRMTKEAREVKEQIRGAISEMTALQASHHQLAFEVDALDYQRREAEAEWSRFQEACLMSCQSLHTEAAIEYEQVKSKATTLSTMSSELRTIVDQHAKSSDERQAMALRVEALRNEREELRRETQQEKERTKSLANQLEQLNSELSREEEAYAELQSCHALLSQQIDQARRTRINEATR